MAQRRSQRRRQDPSTQADNGAASVRPERELIVIARQEAGVRATAAGPRSATGAEVAGLANVLSAAGATLRPLFGASEERLAPAPALRRGPGEELPNLAVYYRVVAPEERLEELAEALREQESVEAAYVKPPAELPRLNDMLPREESPPITPDLTSRQGYLASAPGGIDAFHAWTLPGGRGTGVRVIDIEGAWQFTHEDLLQNQGGIVGGTPTSDVGWRNHGTAVVGEIGGDGNSFGITGISPDANQRAISIFGGVGSAQAIRDAATMLQAGDVILIELHRAGPRFNFQPRDDQRGYIAIEWWPDDFDAIRFAVSRGVLVVEAAGNGAENLDETIYSQRPTGFPASWTNPFDRGNRDSGAIVVGAGAPPPGTHGRSHGPDRSRLDFSNYGNLLDAQGWGREVTTTGYGDLQGGGENEWYTDRFSGTSSASPIIVGALGCVQGVLQAHGRPRLTPASARELLRSTGSPQQSAPDRPSTQRIGTRPDLRQMLHRVLATEERRPTLRLVALHCRRTEDWTGRDEAYLQVNGRRVWGPVSMNNGDSADLTRLAPLPFRRRARVDLFDQDAGWFDRDDHLGTLYAWSTQVAQGEQEHWFTSDGASYRLTYEVSG